MPLSEKAMNPLRKVGIELWTLWSILPCPGIRVGIPRFLFDSQSCLGQYWPKPAGYVHTNVVHFVSILPVPSWPIHVWPVLQDLYSTAFPTCLLSALFLKGKIYHRVNQYNIVHTARSQSTQRLGMVCRTLADHSFIQPPELQQHPGSRSTKTRDYKWKI